METKKDISYLGKDFSQFKQGLIDFTKQYFPTSYTDFTDAAPGMIFLELAAYVGDVLSYYADNNLKESMLEQATERSNIYDIAKSLGYRPNNVVPAYVTMDVFQLVPSTGTGASVAPDYNYALSIKPGMRVKQSTGNAVFRTLDSINFNFSSSIDPTEVTVYEIDSATNILLAKKTSTSSIWKCKNCNIYIWNADSI